MNLQRENLTKSDGLQQKVLIRQIFNCRIMIGNQNLQDFHPGQELQEFKPGCIISSITLKWENRKNLAGYQKMRSWKLKIKLSVICKRKPSQKNIKLRG